MKPPDVRVALAPGYDGPIRIAVFLGPPKHDDDGDQLVALVENLILLGDRGAFVRATAHPADAQMRVTTTHHTPPVQFVWDVSTSRLDHRFAQIFRNQMIMFTNVYCEVVRVTIEMLAPRQPQAAVPLPALEPEAVEGGAVYPHRSGKLTFPVVVGPVADYKSSRRAEIEFSGTMDDDKLAEIRAWFDLWAPTLDCGYAATEEELTDGRHAIFDAATDIIDDVTVQTHIGYWGAPECAWNSFINLVGRADGSLGRVMELRIY